MPFPIVSLLTGVSWFSAQVIHLAARFTLEISSVFICTKQRLYCQRKYVRIDEERQGRAGPAATSARSFLTKHSLSEFLLNRALSLQRSDLLGLRYACMIYWKASVKVAFQTTWTIQEKPMTWTSTTKTTMKNYYETMTLFIWREKFAWAMTQIKITHWFSFLSV